LVHPLLDELAQRGKRERTDLDDAASCRLGDAIQEHRLVLQPPHGKAQRTPRRWVEPLNVIDADHERPIRGHQPQQRQQ
jgi:hypothetical protein